MFESGHYSLIPNGRARLLQSGDSMFTHILVPTDGSDLSHTAAVNAVALAKVTGAHLTAFHVAEPYSTRVHEEHVPIELVLPEDHARHVQQQAAPHLEDVKRLAQIAGVRCTTRMALSNFPAEAIVEAAEKLGCDAIVMGSHGRTGFSKLLLGSETQKVLVRTKVPVLVTH
jgi:nucleotide-binding universal stress UspA family protein